MTEARRPVRFLTAATSMRRPFVGMLARSMNSIPVERPQDLAKPGPGTITSNGAVVRGEGTRFTSTCEPGMSLMAEGISLGAVEEVVSDTELKLKRPAEQDLPIPVSYKVAPNVSHEQLYSEVFGVLKKGGCVAIFPEGGSHDNSSLLPFKAGVAVLTLGAMAEGAPPVRLVPVGLNVRCGYQYFHGHRFRSRALLDFGKPIEIDPKLVEDFRQGGEAKRTACNTVLDMAQRAVEAVTVTTPDYETMRLLWAARRLYKPEHVHLTMEQTQQLSIRFSEAYLALRDEPDVAELRRKVAAYNEHLLSFGLRDHEVLAVSNRTRTASVRRLLGLLFLWVVESLLLLPFMAMGMPILFACRVVSMRKARLAVAKSSVKQKGRDVLATWKILTALIVVPITFAIYGVGLGFVLGARLGLAIWLLLPVIMLSSLRLWDHYSRINRALPALLAAIANPERGAQLYNMRCHLKAEIREFVSRASSKFKLPRMFEEADFAGED